MDRLIDIISDHGQNNEPSDSFQPDGRLVASNDEVVEEANTFYNEISTLTMYQGIINGRHRRRMVFQLDTDYVRIFNVPGLSR